MGCPTWPRPIAAPSTATAAKTIANMNMIVQELSAEAPFSPTSMAPRRFQFRSRTPQNVTAVPGLFLPVAITWWKGRAFVLVALLSLVFWPGALIWALRLRRRRDL